MKAGLGYYRKIFSEISAGDISPLYLLSGEERFIMEEMAQKIISSAIGVDNSGFNLDVEYGSEIDMERFISTANSYPFMGEKRVLVLKELERLKGNWKGLAEYCRDPAPSTVMILMLGTHDENGRKLRLPRDLKVLEKNVAGKGRTISFEKLQKGDLVKWVRQKASRMGVTMGTECAGTLVESVGEDLYSIQNELDKVALVFEGEEVSGPDIAAVIGRYRMGALYDLINDIRPGKVSGIMSRLAGILGSGAERPLTIIYLLTRHFLSILKIKAGASGSGYFYDRLKKMASAFSTREVIVWLENLRYAELTMKSSSYPERLVLESVFLHSMNGTYTREVGPGTRDG